MQEQNNSTSTDIATLPPAERAAVALASTKTEQHLRELVEKSAAITNVIDKDGREEAHRAGMTLKTARVAIEKTGKAAREDAQAFAKAVIQEQQRLVGIVQGEEDRVLALRDHFDAEQARVKAEKDRIEKERVAGIRAKVETIRALAAASFRDSAEQIAATLADLEALEPSEAEFAEFAGEAAEAKAVALAGLRELLEKAQAAEAETARLAAERAELERLRAEQAERERVAAAERAEAEAQAAAARKIEEDRLRAEREAFEDERRAFAEQQAAATRAEQERIDAARRAEEDATWLAKAEDARAGGYASQEQVQQIIGDLAGGDEVAEAARKEQEATQPAPAAPPEFVEVEHIEAAPAPRDDQGRIACLDLVVGDLLGIGFTPDEIRALVEQALAAPEMQVAA